MQTHESDMISVFKLEKQLQLSAAICLSVVLLLLSFLLVKTSANNDLQQALIIIIGLTAIGMLDAFRKLLSSNSSSFTKEYNQIVIRNGGYYINGNVDKIDKRLIVEGGYVGSADIVNYGNEKRQSLAEAASDIQDLLKQLEQSNPTASDAEKVAYINEEIEPDLKSRFLNAVKVGGEEAIESSLDRRYINVMKAIIQAWL